MVDRDGATKSVQVVGRAVLCDYDWRIGLHTPVKRTALKKMGTDKARETRKYWPLKAAFLVQHEFCEVPHEVHDCSIRSTQVHHMKGQNWRVMNDMKFWLPTCMNGHAWIEDHKNRAREMGLILYK